MEKFLTVKIQADGTINIGNLGCDVILAGWIGYEIGKRDLGAAWYFTNPLLDYDIRISCDHVITDIVKAIAQLKEKKMKEMQ